MEKEVEGKNGDEKAKGKKLWDSMGRKLPTIWVVIAILLFIVVTTWLKLGSLKD